MKISKISKTKFLDIKLPKRRIFLCNNLKRSIFIFHISVIFHQEHIKCQYLMRSIFTSLNPTDFHTNTFNVCGIWNFNGIIIKKNFQEHFSEHFRCPKFYKNKEVFFSVKIENRYIHIYFYLNRSLQINHGQCRLEPLHCVKYRNFT